MSDVFDRYNFGTRHLFEQFSVCWRNNRIARAEDDEQRRHRRERRDAFVRWFGAAICNTFVMGQAKGSVSKLFNVVNKFLRHGESRPEPLGQSAPNCMIGSKMRKKLANKRRKIGFGGECESGADSGRTINENHRLDPLRIDLGDGCCYLTTHRMTDNRKPIDSEII